MIVGGRRGHSSSSVAQEQTRMARREQIKDVTSESQEMDDDTQVEEDYDNGNDKDQFSSSLLSQSSARGKSRKKEHKTKSKKMTEEEMMDLALRLSEQEASATALRQQQEEDAMMKAIQESMGRQTHLYLPSQSQSLLPEAKPSLRLSSRRKLLLSNGKTVSASQEISGANGPGHENNNRNKKRKRKEGSPLLEMPDLSQNSCSQASSCSSMSPSVLPDSPESRDSTQIDESQLRKSPIFPLTDSRPEVHVTRISQGMLQTYRSSGFVLCSQDSLPSNPNHLPAQPMSPTFPKSPSNLALSKNTVHPKSPIFSETDQGDDGEMELSPVYYKSPVFGRNCQHERLPTACQPTSENSGFVFSSQETLSSSVRPTSCWSRSPVFPGSSSLPKKVVTSETSAFPKSPVPSDNKRGHDGQTEQSHGHPSRTQNIQLEGQEKSVMSSAAELQGSSRVEIPPDWSTTDSSLSLRQDRRMHHSQDGTFNKGTLLLKSVLDDTEQLNESSKEWNSEMELTSDMTLHWSDEDEDVTPVGSPSPIFPEERLIQQLDGPAASLNHLTAASPGMNGPNCRSQEDQSSLNRHLSPQPSTSSRSTYREQFSTTKQESQQVCSASAPPGEPAGGMTVHYYWGVPFCPRGLNPDSYTQVILAQMEVYEKSLKQAQRCLLKKAEWGEPILPQLEKSPSPELPADSTQEFVPRRRGLRLGGRKLSEAADSPAAETEEEEDKKDEGKEETEKKEEERNERGEEEQVDTDDCEVCPETQLSDNDSTQDLMIAIEDGAKISPPLQHKSPEQAEVEMVLQVDSPGRAEQQEEEEKIEVDAPVDTEMEGNNPVSSQNVTKEWKEEDSRDLDVEEIKDRWLQRSKSPELQPVVIPQRAETNVDCPICQGSFPVAEIEMHAAYCDGEVAVVQEKRPEVDCFQGTSKLRRKRTRRAEEPTDPSNIGKNQEKCFICQKAVPLRAYSRHTELCIQQQGQKTKGNLLSALQQTESRDSEAGPSGSRLQPADVIDLRDDEDDDYDDGDEDEEEEERGTASRFRISKKQQPAKKPSQRRR